MLLCMYQPLHTSRGITYVLACKATSHIRQSHKLDPESATYTKFISVHFSLVSLIRPIYIYIWYFMNMKQVRIAHILVNIWLCLSISCDKNRTINV